jgi:hypothetical protein
MPGKACALVTSAGRTFQDHAKQYRVEVVVLPACAEFIGQRCGANSLRNSWKTQHAEQRSASHANIRPNGVSGAKRQPPRKARSWRNRHYI